MEQAGHSTNDELLAALYGLGTENQNHLSGCTECQSRLAAMSGHRAAIESQACLPDAVDTQFLAAQRRAIYRRIDQPVRWWHSSMLRRCAAGATAAGLLTGSALLYEQNREARLAQERISDARLVQEVSSMANDTDPAGMAPLQGLFEQ